MLEVYAYDVIRTWGYALGKKLVNNIFVCYLINVFPHNNPVRLSVLWYNRISGNTYVIVGMGYAIHSPNQRNKNRNHN